ncbi:preprotein translocase subunit SecG [Spongiibacter nanhainus]|uniref:Protein-export membrane protein SecG n=1 Tax=Spongiibacter nanhainus TaxID=2794344 RepID=A0A7T4QZJ8_9GAMM|nr:preprotein translocase subunit SecG [Spongiibacter nanhainus]QQD17709.1 preprotein translocase subunit SecG [Spongiibacter nanhainus]
MEQLILIIHVITALAIIGLILVQQGKGAEMGASFGAGASQTLFGSAGNGNVLTRATAILATLFFLTSLSLAYVAKQKTVEDVDLIDIPVVEESRDIAPVPSEGAGSADMPAVGGSSADTDMPSVGGDAMPSENSEDVPASDMP